MEKKPKKDDLSDVVLQMLGFFYKKIKFTFKRKSIICYHMSYERSRRNRFHPNN